MVLEEWWVGRTRGPHTFPSRSVLHKYFVFSSAEKPFAGVNDCEQHQALSGEAEALSRLAAPYLPAGTADGKDEQKKTYTVAFMLRNG